MPMNIFRLIGDLSHVMSLLIMCHHLRTAQNARGISAKSIELYLIVYATRYLDLFTQFYSMYNSFMKCFYIFTTTWILYNIRFQDPICSTYDRARDAYSHWKFAVAPCAIIAFIITKEGDLLQLLWNFSICLESIAIIPQLMILKHYRDVDDLIQYSILLLGSYRGFYIMNWIYRSYHESFYRHNFVVYFCGVLQCILYFDFYYNFFLVRNNCGRRTTTTNNGDNIEDDENFSSDNNTSSNDRQLLTIYLLDESRWVA